MNGMPGKVPGTRKKAQQVTRVPLRLEPQVHLASREGASTSANISLPLFSFRLLLTVIIRHNYFLKTGAQNLITFPISHQL